MEKTFILKDAHLPSNNVARYSTLDKNIDLIIFLRKPIEWPNRLKEECFRCERCHCFMKPKEPKSQKDNAFYHKITCNPRLSTVEKEVSDGINTTTT